MQKYKKFTTYHRKTSRVVGCVKCPPLFFHKFIHYAKVTTIVTKLFTKFTTKIGDSWNLCLFLAQNMSLNLVICFISHKHRKNCECCHHHSIFKGHNVIVHIVVLNCQKCNQCLKCQVSGHKSLGLLFEAFL